MIIKKYFFGIIYSVLFLASFSNGENQLEIQTHYMLNTWEGSSSPNIDADGSGFLVAFNYGPEYGSFLETFYYYASANEGAVSSPVNQTLSVDLESRATGMYLGVGYRQKLINKLDYTISGGVGSQTIDAKGFEVGGNPTVDDSKKAFDFYWKTGISYAINEIYDVGISYQYLGKNNKATWVSEDSIGYELTGLSISLHRML